MNRTHNPLDRQTYICVGRRGHSLKLDVIGSDPAIPRPCLMWIHGGGLIFGSRTMSPRPYLLEALVQLGFIVASVDHRLAPETKLESIVEDVQDLWRWLHEQGPSLIGSDPGRMCIAGASAGAYLSLLGGYRLSPKPKAIGSLWGFGDITAPWEADPSEHYRKVPLVSRSHADASLALTPVPTASGDDRSAFYLFCRQQGLWLQEVTGHDLPAGRDWLHSYCPVLHIAQNFPPTVLVHGQVDTDVPCSESDLLAAKLLQAQVPHQYLSLQGVGHGFSGASTDVVQSTEQDFAEFLWRHAAANER